MKRFLEKDQSEDNKKHTKIEKYIHEIVSTPEIDQETLLKLPLDQLAKISAIDFYTSNICDSTFWKKKFLSIYSIDLGFNIDYKQLLYVNDKEKIRLTSFRVSELLFIQFLSKLFVKCTGLYYYTLMIATQNNQLNIVKFILTHENYIHQSNSTIYSYMFIYGSLDIVTYLLNNLKLDPMDTPTLISAIRNGNSESIKYGIDKQLFYIEDKGDELLSAAVDNCDMDLITYFVGKGFTNYNKIPHFVLKFDKLEILMYLVEHMSLDTTVLQEILIRSVRICSLNTVKYMLNEKNHTYCMSFVSSLLTHSIFNTDITVFKYISSVLENMQFEKSPLR